MKSADVYKQHAEKSFKKLKSLIKLNSWKVILSFYYMYTLESVDISNAFKNRRI